MSVFSAKPGDNARRIMELLDCPCKYYPAGKPLQLIRSAYEEAYAMREMGGYTPVIIVVFRMMAEWIEGLYGGLPGKEEREKLRQRNLSEAVPDAREWFTRRLSEMKEEYGEYWNEVTAENGDTGEKSDRLSGFVDFVTKKSSELILAEIPTEKPWEVFAWLPFGGWNECPDPPVIAAAARYWYERFHAVPALISHDVLEFTAYPVRDKSAAVGLALEQYAFCSDIVDQGVQTIEILADTLSKSSVWYFWWD